MNRFILAALLLFTSVLSAQVNIIPAPVSIQMKGGNDFTIDLTTALIYKNTNPDLKSAAKFFKNHISNISGIELKENTGTTKKISLEIKNVPNVGLEGYVLTVMPNSIEISANSRAGVIYAMQSLFQVLPAIRTNAALTVPSMSIIDYPRFKWRGMHLDVSRHFFGPEFIKEYIDLLASYKMNTFHWHLVDDQGWRIEIKKYPNLTATGAWRVNQNDKPWSSRPQAKSGEAATYGGYYTQAQIKEIIKYAAERNVTIVPEIEMPGHVASAIASYPWLSCTQKPQLPLTGGNYAGTSSNYCAGNDSVFHFLEDVLTEVMALFPSKYIHIGGDEVEKGPWKKCPKCQARMKKEGLKNEEELQSYFIKRIEKFVVSKGKKMIGWDEILEGGLAPEATVMSWRGMSGGIAAAKQQHDVIMTPGYPLYFDHYQAGPEGEPVAFSGMNTLKNVYDFEPIPVELNKDEAKYILGAQANLWAEHITTVEGVEYMVLPRMAALAEVVWSPVKARNWELFLNRLQGHYKIYEQKGLHYCAGNFAVKIKPVASNGKLLAELSNEIQNSDIVYTLDGTEPTIGSLKYTTPVPIDRSVILKASTVVNGEIMNRQAAKQEFILHKAIGKSISYLTKPSTSYPADGPNTLIDGIKGTQAINKYWHGFSGNDLVATIDLEQNMTVRSISLGCLQGYSNWIFLPQWVKFEVSQDGKTYKELETVKNPFDIHADKVQHDFKITFNAIDARYIRITAKNNICPTDHPGAGSPGWIFADEIVVE